MKVSVIIPLLNEADNIDYLIDQLNGYFLKNDRLKAEIIFVNDGSQDDTVAKLKAAEHIAYQAKVIGFSKNFGSHAALRAGIQVATGEYITFMYADLQDPLELIYSLFKEIDAQQAEICWAFRDASDVSKTERVFSKAYAFLMQRYAVPNFPKNGFDIVMFSKKVQACMNQNVESNSSVFIQILSLGYKQAAVRYTKKTRLHGKSKWTVSKKIKLLIDSFVAFSFAPIRLVSLVGVLFFTSGILWTGYIIFRKMVFDDLESGWPALISILMVGFGITNISLGIIAEYLWRTLDASRKRPVFVIDEISELNRIEEPIVVPQHIYQ
jgi:dolichol-phosphate mannosyltransferase